MIRKIFSSFAFITVLPLKTNYFGKYTVAFFPFVGIFIGVMLTLIFKISIMLFNVNLATALVIVSYVLITGGFHLDGFADTIDALSGSFGDKKRAQEIMSDSHIGAMGVIGLILILGVNYVSLSYVLTQGLWRVLLIYPVLGRWGIVLALFLGTSAKEEGLGKLIKGLTDIRVFGVATLLSLGYCILVFNPVVILMAFLVVMSLEYMFIRYFHKKIGGITGDILGFLNEISSVISILYFAAMVKYV